MKILKEAGGGKVEIYLQGNKDQNYIGLLLQTMETRRQRSELLSAERNHTNLEFCILQS